MYKLIYLILLLGFQEFLSAQEYDFPKKINDNFVFFKSQDNKIHVLQNSFEYVYEKGKWTENKLNYRPLKRDSLILFHKKGFDNTNFKVVSDQNKTFLVLSGGGPVLQKEGDSIFRIDNSVEQRNQFGAATFIYKNNIFMYGGYGFWSFKNYITYYDFSSNQWELLRTQSEKQPPARRKPVFSLVKNKLYVMGGRSNSANNYTIDIALKDLFVVDMDSKRIETLTSEFNPKIPISFHTHNNGFDFENKRGYLKNKIVTVFDFPNNTFYNYKTNNVFDKKLSHVPILSFSDTLVFVKKINGVKKLTFLSLNEIKKNGIESFPIVLAPVEKTYSLQILFALLCLFLVFFVYKLFSYKDYIDKLIQFDENWLYFSGKKIRISSEQSLAVVLLEKYGEFTSNDLNKIVSKKKKYAKSHLTLLRKVFIKNFNDTFAELLDLGQDLVNSEKLPSDKRQILYRTNKEISKKESFLKFMFKF